MSVFRFLPLLTASWLAAMAGPVRAEPVPSGAVSPQPAESEGSPLAPLPAVSGGRLDEPPRHVRIAMAPLTWDEEPGQGVSFGMENGLWGSSWAQGLRLGVGLGRHFALHGRGLFVMGTEEDDDEPFTADAGGRLDLIGRSAPILNVIRLYGGGGVQAFAPAANVDGRKPSVSGGGHFGFEFFYSPWLSAFLEVGGQGGPAPGATVLAGMSFYPWTGP